jgi:hypothetical protein
MTWANTTLVTRGSAALRTLVTWVVLIASRDGICNPLKPNSQDYTSTPTLGTIWQPKKLKIIGSQNWLKDTLFSFSVQCGAVQWFMNGLSQREERIAFIFTSTASRRAAFQCSVAASRERLWSSRNSKSSPIFSVARQLSLTRTTH